MPIGETLTEARRQAGLTVTQVSERTRIRETIIRGVEDDDYSSCGGDFYARGNIRAIAKVIGTDSGPLIREYDAVHRAPGTLSTVSLDELVSTSVQAPQRRRPDLEDVPAFVELESGGPPPVTCRVVGVGRPPSHPTKEGDRREQHLSEGPPSCPA